jgi:tetratricopeptide (TPR) repeat protein
LARGEILERIDYVRNLIEIDISYSKDPIAYFIYSFYSHLRLLLWPVRLTFYHEPVIMIQNLVNYGLFFSILMIPFLLLTFKKAKEIFFSFCLFFIFLLPTYSPISVSSFFIAERYVYLPSIAFSMSIAFLYERGDYRYKKFRKYFLFVLIIIISLYGLRVILRNEDWKSVDIWRQKTLEASPGSWKAHNNIGSLYLQKGNFRRAIEEFEKAITLNSDSAMIYNNLGIAYQYFGNKEKAISFFKKAIELKPSLVIAYNSLGVIYYELNGRENAILLFNKAIELDSRYANAYTNLGSVYYNIDEYEKAIELYKKAIEINPNLAIAHTNLALAFYFTKQYELAIKHCDKALQLGYKVEPALLKLLKPYRKK